MYCKHCGHALENGMCPECGWQKPVDSASANPQINNNPAPPVQPVGQPAFVAQNAQGKPIMPNQQPVGQQGFPPQQPPVGQQGFTPQQPPVGQQGFTPQRQPVGQQGFPAQQPPVGQQGFPAQKPPVGQQGFPAQQPPVGQQGFPAQRPPVGQQGFPAQRPPVGQPPYGRGPGVPGQPPMGPGSGGADNGKKKRNIIIISVIALLLIVGIVAAVLILNKPDDDDGDPTTATTAPTTISTTQAPTTTTEEPDPDEITRTIMVYIVGSDLESEGFAASSDIEEMLESGYDESKINVVLYTGGSLRWYTPEIDSSYNCTLTIENSKLKLLQKEPQQNMGSPETLSNFINYAYENFPADQYDLILWNHGGGPFFGYGVDQLTGDNLYINELQTALDNTPLDGHTDKFDFIGFDACLMGNTEVACALSPYADYLIASEEPEPGYGWNYSFLKDAGSRNNGAEIGNDIITHYMSYSDSVMTSYNYSRVGLSVIDLNRVDELVSKIDALFAVAESNLTATSFSEYSRIVSNSVSVFPGSDDSTSYDLIDLYSLAQNLAALYPAEAQALCDTIGEIVLYNQCNEDNMYGLTIYHPDRNKDYTSHFLQNYYAVSFSDTYESYINAYGALLLDPSTLVSSWDPATMIPYKNSDYTFSLQLDDAQAADVNKVYYVISRADTEQPGNFVFVAMGNEVEMSASNLLTAEFDGQVRYMNNYTQNFSCEIMYTEQESDGNRTRYLIPSILYNNDIQEEDALYCYFVLETSKLNPTGELIACYPMMNYIDSNGTDIYPSRYEINIYDYNYVAFGNMSHEFTSTEDLTNFNENDWSDVVLNYTSFNTTDDFSTCLDSMFDDIPYYGMFIIEDSQGNRHCSNLVQLK